jgi:hypothetical protein
MYQLHSSSCSIKQRGNPAYGGGGGGVGPLH